MEMDKEFIDMIVRLKCESKILRGLVDAIIESTYLSYTGKDLRINDGDKIITVLKTFFGDELEIRLKELKIEEEKEEESDNG